MSKKYVLITGASMGIGYELSKLFAQDHYNLIITARSEDKLLEIKNELEEKYNIHVKVLKKDLADPNAPSEILSELEKENIKINVLVNNAGFAVFGEFLDTDLRSELEMIQVNITALTQLTKIFADKMAANGGGKILNVASTAAFQPGPLMSIYYASKAYVLSFSQALNVEFKDHNILVSTLCPGPTRTGFQERAGMNDSKLFSTKKLVVKDAHEVAEEAYRGLKENKSLIITGTLNKLISFSTRFAPRQFLAKLVKNIQESK